MDKLKRVVSGESKNLKVLDVGTGIGDFIEVLKESLPGYSSIIGIDLEQVTINKAIERNKDNRIEFMCMDGENMGFDDNSIDIISISNTLHHLPHKEKVLSEMKRVLKPDGLIIINEMICDNQSDKQLSHVKVHHLQGELDTLFGRCHNKTFTLQELEEIADSLKLEKVDIFQYNTHEEQKDSENLEEEKEILDKCFQALEAKIGKIDNLIQREGYLETLEKLRSKLYNIGIFGATEVMIVCRKN
jgi:ubiquinone/menaquinone biosynthesis C-methylase UbiE